MLWLPVAAFLAGVAGLTLGWLGGLLLIAVAVAWLLAALWLRRVSDAGRLMDLEDEFKGRIVSYDAPREVRIGTAANEWNIGVLGVDSNARADCYARGFVEYDLLRKIDQHTLSRPWDLCVFLVHHHLFPVRSLEYDRRGAKSLLNLTCLANAGHMLESLSKSHVDLVLHGHEHAANWATYGSLHPARGRVRVIGAASATGNASVGGAKVERAGFNVFILSPDRSARFRQVGFSKEDNEFEVSNEYELFDRASIRHAQLRRTHSKDLHAERLETEVVKYVELTRERDVLGAVALPGLARRRGPRAAGLRRHRHAGAEERQGRARRRRGVGPQGGRTRVQ